MTSVTPIIQYYTKFDFFIMFVRGCLLPIFMVTNLGWLYGLVLYYASFQLYYRALKYVFKFESLSALDEFFLLDNEKNRANIITVVKLDKM
jgi:hypothetical protein